MEWSDGVGGAARAPGAPALRAERREGKIGTAAPGREALLQLGRRSESEQRRTRVRRLDRPVGRASGGRGAARRWRRLGRRGGGEGCADKHSADDMFGLDEPHPYGVQPLGNLFLVTDEDRRQRRRRGLGASLNGMSDEALIELLGFLGPNELARVSSCSRALYVYAHHSDLWRDLTLRSFFDEVVRYKDSWKETFVSMLYHKNGWGAHIRHVPLRVSGIYSNLLHRSWACHSCDLETACPGFYSFHNDVTKVNAASLSQSDFVNDFEMKNVPVVIANAVASWPAFQKWTSTYLGQIGKDRKFRATSATAPLAATFTLEEYFNYARQAREEAPLYLFERDFCKLVPELQSDFSVPPYFDPKAVTSDTNQELPQCYRTDLFRIFGEAARPDWRWLICGPARSGSIFHIDPNQTNAWNVSITGRKKWIFYPPGVPPPGVVADSTGAEVTVPISTGEWLLSFWKAHLECRRDPDVRRRPLEVIADPGDVVFVPHGYWHMVLNLDQCVALTQNYVSTANLADCLRFLRDTPDQISGVRDRESEAVQPEEFYNLFLARLATELTADELEEVVNESKKAHSLAPADVLDPSEQKRQELFEWNRRKVKKGGRSLAASASVAAGEGTLALDGAGGDPTGASAPFAFAFSL